MKKWLFLIGVVGLLAIGAAAEDVFTKVKINLSTSDAPNFRNAGNATPSANPSWRNKWLIIEVEYYPIPPESMQKAKIDDIWINDVDMTVRATFTGKDDKLFCFSGVSRFWTIPLNSVRHVATMMVPPQLLDRYFPDSGRANPGSFNIEVSFRDRAGTEIGKASLEKHKSASGTATEVSDAVLPRNLTPWAVVDADKYDLLKPAGVASGVEK